MAGKLFFTLQYWLNNPRWDTGITPPELIAYLENNSPGSALDLGCGTGTNVLTMARYGWQAAGIDYVPRAIRAARRKARREGLEGSVRFIVGDVLAPDLAQDRYDLVLDIGCFHSFSGSDVDGYLHNLRRWLAPGGGFLLYTHLKAGPGAGHGTAEEDLAKLEAGLKLVRRQDGEESSHPSAWLEFRR